MTTHHERHEHTDGYWALATRCAAPAVRACVPRYVGYEEQTRAPVRRFEVPHPNITVILNLGERIGVHAPELSAPGATFRSFVAGLFDTVAITDSAGFSSGIELNLTPLGMWQLVGVPMHELTNHVLHADALFGAAAESLEAQLRDLTTWEARFDLLDVALTRALARRVAAPAEVRWAWALLTSHASERSVSDIASELRWSRRRLGAAFREHVGMTPKAIARVVRFDRVVQEVRRGRRARWSSVACEHGYADQAHLCREFQEFAGLSPTEFQRRQGAGLAGVAAS